MLRKYITLIQIAVYLCESEDFHHRGVIMGTMASQITVVSIVYSTVCQAQMKKHQSSASRIFIYFNLSGADNGSSRSRDLGQNQGYMGNEAQFPCISRPLSAVLLTRFDKSVIFVGFQLTAPSVENGGTFLKILENNSKPKEFDVHVNLQFECLENNSFELGDLNSLLYHEGKPMLMYVS